MSGEVIMGELLSQAPAVAVLAWLFHRRISRLERWMVEKGCTSNPPPSTGKG